jgi:translation initiation factor IF-2
MDDAENRVYSSEWTRPPPSLNVSPLASANQFSIRRPLLPKQQGPLLQTPHEQVVQPDQLKPPQLASDLCDVANLRLALFGDRKRPTPSASPGNNQSTATSQRTVTTAPAASATKYTSQLESATTDFDARLSDFIRRIQADQAKRAAAEQAVKDSTSAGNVNVDQSPLPQWRITEGRLHVNLRSSRNHHHRHQRQALDRASALAWGRPTDAERKRPAFVDPKEQVIKLPPFPLTLVEASFILRERMTRVRRLLRDVLGVQRSRGNYDGEGSGGMIIDPETMELLAMELDKKFEKIESKSEGELLLQRRAEASAAAAASDTNQGTQAWTSLPSRPPVVCLLGHVDHGKTTLMDALRRRSQQLQSSERKSKNEQKSRREISFVAGTEAGGITQVVSAFEVALTSTPPGESTEDQISSVTFLDTPGHAAFKAMRQSGSDAADIIVLVVAADDGVSSQTVEILNFYKAIIRGAGSGGISLVVAMNKIDKPGVDVEESRRRVESQLLEHGIIVEGMPYSDEGEFGPPVQLIPVSGLTGQGIDDLIEGLMIQAEVMDLRGDENARAEGIVMDARVEKGLGNVVDCIIRWGSLSKGDIVVSGTSMGRVRILKDMSGKSCSRGLPSQPVRIVGFDTLPKAGDPMVCVKSEEAATDLVSRRLALVAGDVDDSSSVREAELQSAGKHMMHGDWKGELEEKHCLDSDDGSYIRIPVVVKADADGTLSAIRDALMEIGNQSRHSVVIEPVKSGVGPVLASEIQLAKEGAATIVCFNVRNEQAIMRMAEDEGVALISSKVIYSLLDMARDEFAKYLPAQSVEVVHGRAEVQAIYDIGGMSDQVAGLRVSEGKLYRVKTESQGDSQFRVLRNGRIISESELRASSLKHFKDDVEEIGRGKECGLSLAGYKDFQVGDVIECFSIRLSKEFV